MAPPPLGNNVFPEPGYNRVKRFSDISKVGTFFMKRFKRTQPLFQKPKPKLPKSLVVIVPLGSVKKPNGIKIQPAKKHK